MDSFQTPREGEPMESAHELHGPPDDGNLMAAEVKYGLQVPTAIFRRVWKLYIYLLEGSSFGSNGSLSCLEP